jgi:uncharacterized protein YkwD
MKRALLGIATLLLVSAPLAQGEGPADEARMTLRQEMLRLINRDRATNGLGIVQLDPESSAIADSYCEQQIRNGTTGHFTIDGYAPYMRYSFAGGNDGISENAAAWSANYNFTDRLVYGMARRSQQAMLLEQAPHDGHRRTILDPYATHVGIGLAWNGGEFRMAQEFVRRYLSWTRPLPRAAGLHEPISASARPAPGYRVEAISVHHEPIPVALTAKVANAISSYSLPEARRDYLPRLKTWVHPRGDGTFQVVREEYTDGSHGDFSVSDDGTFTFPVPFQEGPGVYTVVVWLKRKGDTAPIAASNISIRVDQPAYSTFAGTR